MDDAAEWPCPNTSLKYEKGENRLKHVGRDKEAKVVKENGLDVGKCPKSFSIAEAENILQSGIPEFRKTTAEKPFRIWAYHKGAIYVAHSQDGGKTWHGFPIKEEPPRKIKQQLEQSAQSLGEEKLLKKWLRK